MDPSRFGQTGARIACRRLTRRTALASGGAGLGTALLGGGLAARPAAAQDATPSPITEVGQVPGTVGTLFSVVAPDLPAPPVEITLARVVSQPGDGDLEDFFTFPGPLAFVLESGTEVCRCGTAESPCLLLHADGTSEPAPPIPADIPLGQGEGLFIPANTPDSFFIPGDEPAVELDLSIFPPRERASTSN
jgi:hypothetical protein